MNVVELFFHGLTCGIRPLGLLIVLPLGWDLLGVSARISISAAFAVFVAPHVPVVQQFSIGDCLAEIVLGMLLGLPAALLIECASNAGELFDTLRGQTIATVYEPLQQQVVSLSAIMAKWVVWVLILSNGSAAEFAGALLHSFKAIPPGGMVVGGVQGLGWKVLLLVPKFLALAMTACLPFAFACIAIELVLAFVSKQMPSLSLTTEGFLAKQLVAIGAVLIVVQPETARALTTLAAPLSNLLSP
jgi:type III secretory pathway component EscT